MKRTHTINIPVTAEEKRKIESKAEKFGMNVATFLRYISLRGKFKTTTEIV